MKRFPPDPENLILTNEIVPMKDKVVVFLIHFFSFWVSYWIGSCCCSLTADNQREEYKCKQHHSWIMSFFGSIQIMCLCFLLTKKVNHVLHKQTGCLHDIFCNNCLEKKYKIGENKNPFLSFQSISFCERPKPLLKSFIDKMWPVIN